jgi:hypothetical protein
VSVVVEEHTCHDTCGSANNALFGLPVGEEEEDSSVSGGRRESEEGWRRVGGGGEGGLEGHTVDLLNTKMRLLLGVAPVFFFIQNFLCFNFIEREKARVRACARESTHRNTAPPLQILKLLPNGYRHYTPDGVFREPALPSIYYYHYN